GTWQDSLSDTTQNPSNIARLTRAISTEDRRGVDGVVIPQIAYYHPGLGTDVGPFKSIRNILAGLFGWGLMQHIKSIYGFISYNYELGDEIFLFGFSRGAFLARIINGFISDFGVLKKPGMSEFVDIFTLYTSREFAENSKLKAIQQALIKNNVLVNPNAVIVKVIGCFDTIGALGIPRLFPFQRNQYEFFNLSLTCNVEYALHALALDETRKAFRPTLWFFPPNRDSSKYKQVWFNGAHINVGGGDFSHSVPKSNYLHSHDAVANVLSDGPLIWMVSECQKLLQFD
ncbi:hypothetical protein V1512DRAFT_196108, partial [Lipomyces arxii]|uniref:uncharacterized protein n=1 Tax=Lipomyces arxii TaxID=56418 RepID=UPI0034CE82EF